MKHYIGVLLVAVQVTAAAAQVFTYTDSVAYHNDLVAFGYVEIWESFESDFFWGGVRSPDAAPSVTSQTIEWTSNYPTNQVTTSTGPPRTGDWGFYSIPHGNFSAGAVCDTPGVCGDGFVGTRTAAPLFGVGGWITGFFGGKLEIVLDGDVLNAIDFGDVLLGNTHQFFGVIDLGGFTTFEFRETEGTRDDQKFMWADDFTFGVTSVTGVPLDPHAGYLLEQNVPNPFNPTTNIRFTLAKAGRTSLRIYGVDGKLVAELVDEELAADTYTYVWNGKYSSGQTAATGIYFYQLRSGDIVQSKRMVLLK